jgi:hypothetical protein
VVKYLPIRREMLEPDGMNEARSVHEHVTRALGSIGGGIGEVTFSLTLAEPRKPIAPETAVQGQITWSFIANPKLELVDMYVDVVKPSNFPR